jgi:protein SCO1
MQISKSRLFLVLSLVVLAGLLAAFAITRPASSDWASAPPEIQAILWPGARDIADFTELDQGGKPFGKDDLKGHWSLLYFGYLQCPDICPTTLRSLSAMRSLMAEGGQAGEIPRIVFVSVDPANDTPQRIASYLGFFSSELIGLSGEPSQLEKLARSLGIVYAENIEASGVRSMEHTTSIIVVDPQARAVAALPAPHQPRVMLQQFNALRDFLAH